MMSAPRSSIRCSTHLVDLVSVGEEWPFSQRRHAEPYLLSGDLGGPYSVSRLEKMNGARGGHTGYLKTILPELVRRTKINKRAASMNPSKQLSSEMGQSLDGKPSSEVAWSKLARISTWLGNVPKAS